MSDWIQQTRQTFQTRGLVFGKERGSRCCAHCGEFVRLCHHSRSCAKDLLLDVRRPIVALHDQAQDEIERMHRYTQLSVTSTEDLPYSVLPCQEDDFCTSSFVYMEKDPWRIWRGSQSQKSKHMPTCLCASDTVLVLLLYNTVLHSQQDPRDTM